MTTSYVKTALFREAAPDFKSIVLHLTFCMPKLPRADSVAGTEEKSSEQYTSMDITSSQFAWYRTVKAWLRYLLKRYILMLGMPCTVRLLNIVERLGGPVVRTFSDYLGICHVGAIVNDTNHCTLLQRNLIIAVCS